MYIAVANEDYFNSEGDYEQVHALLSNALMEMRFYISLLTSRNADERLMWIDLSNDCIITHDELM